MVAKQDKEVTESKFSVRAERLRLFGIKRSQEPDTNWKLLLAKVWSEMDKKGLFSGDRSAKFWSTSKEELEREPHAVKKEVRTLPEVTTDLKGPPGDRSSIPDSRASKPASSQRKAAAPAVEIGRSTNQLLSCLLRHYLTDLRLYRCIRFTLRSNSTIMIGSMKSRGNYYSI